MDIFCLPPVGPTERSTSFCALPCTAPACLSVGFMGIKTVFFACFPWDAKAPAPHGGMCLGRELFGQQHPSPAAGHPPRLTQRSQGGRRSSCLTGPSCQGSGIAAVGSGAMAGAGQIWQWAGGVGWCVQLGGRKPAQGCRWELYPGRKASK